MTRVESRNEPLAAPRWAVEGPTLAIRVIGVARTSSGGLTQWRYKGRLVARQLDATHVVIRTDFAPRYQLLSRFPGTFHVPARYERHMMVVADLES